VLDPLLAAIPAKSYGPQLPSAALVTQATEPLGDELAELGLGLGLGDETTGLGLGDDTTELGLGELGLGESELGLGDVSVALGPAVSELGLGDASAALGPGELDDGDGEAEVPLDPGKGHGECSGALWVSGSQPVSMTMVADTASAGQIRFSFTSSSFACRRPNLGHLPSPVG
jgi:hypothetical protein